MNAENLSLIFFAFSVASLLWTIAGIVRPKYVLKWAITDNQTKMHALFFGASVTLFIASIGIALHPRMPWWCWIFPPALGVVIFMLYGEYSTTDIQKEYWRKRFENDRLEKQLNERKARNREYNSFNYGISNDNDDTFDEDKDDINKGWTDEDYWLEEWRDELDTYYKKHISTASEKRLRSIFGGDRECLYTFMMYVSRIESGKKFFIVPPDDRYRRRFEMLERGGLANRLSGFNREVLNELPLARLREIGKAAGLQKLKNDTIGSRKMLLELPDEILAQAFPACGIDFDSIYTLETLDPKKTP